ncbi:IS1380 family transposase, partial [Billgrantia desiderata]|uniref:IS1380 family transposase n=1 Tax=Billgrantia desiderata TaxID=52021 RepID=UPI00089ECA2B
FPPYTRLELNSDANALRRDPVFKLGAERLPLEAEQDLASAPTFSRLENAANTRDLYRLAEAFVEQFVASYAKPPKVIVLDMDHAEDQTHGQQELAFYNHHYQSHCYLPLFLFEGLSGKFITAALRPGKRPKGAENAMILKRVLKRLRQHWPETRILLRGDGHFANVELMQLALDDPYTDFLFGLAGNSRLKRLPEPHLEHTRRLHETRCHNARLAEQEPPQRSRTFHELDYQACSWPQAFRTVLKAEVMGLGDNPRFVVTSLEEPAPEMLYAELLQGTELSRAQPSTVIIKLFKLAVRVVQYKDRIKLHLPSSCPVKALLHTITERLYRLPRPTPNTS